MYSKTKLLLKYLNYWLTSSSTKGHGMHSPFVFDFITNVLNDTRDYYCYNSIEYLRILLKRDESSLFIKDFGAGSRVDSNIERTVASIAKTALKPKKYSRLLFRIINYYQPKTIIELGTSLGVTTAYLASGKNDAHVITMEGAPSVAHVAKNNFKKLELSNIELVQGNFDVTLKPTLTTVDTIDFAFIDGNHRYAPTVDYFEQLLPKSHNDTILILDDIHWSKEMDEAWNYVKKHDRVTATIDLFFIGIVLLRKEFKTKQHFVIRY